MAVPWTEDRVEILTTLWREGASASQIARRLGGGVTRNAVIGKVHRLGLCGRVAPRLPGARRSERLVARPVRRPRPPRAEPAPAAACELPDTGLATVAGVRRGQCRWPMGDPLADGFRLCGRPVGRGAYCAAHGAVAYRPAPPDQLLKLAGLR